MSEEKIVTGYYKGRVVAGSEQYGTTPKGTEQIVLEVGVPSLARTFSTFLYFSEAAAAMSLDRLRACGWKGDDISKLEGIDTNEIDIHIKYETYDGKERMKVEIATGGGGKIKLDNQMDDKSKRAFAARMKLLIKGTNGAPKAAHLDGGSDMPSDEFFGL